MNTQLTEQEQFQCLNVLDLLSDLFTAKEQFTREDILIILDHVRSDPEMFDPGVVIAQQDATRDIV